MDELVRRHNIVKSAFHKSVRGAGHIALGKPCQDYSISYEECGMVIAVVCDGHGGNTYFRSDVGARFAAEITLGRLREFARNIPPETFANKKFALTAKPKRNPFIDAEGKRVRYEEMNEEQQRYARQVQVYVEAEGQFKEQQACIETLLKKIYDDWRREIRKDEEANPLSKNERAILNGQGIEKAYGCTLLAFMGTPHYWLSFHIGDGKIFVCDRSLSWTSPVPEDCTCFLNYTTSLCDNSPLDEFRYAFSGSGEQPFAVMLCSDGVDGSLRTDDNLQDFYEQIIGLFLDGDNVEEELSSYLPILSADGNRDDISISGFVSLKNVDTEVLRKKLEIKKKNRDIKADYRTRVSEIDAIKEKIDTLSIKYQTQQDLCWNKQTELDGIRHRVQMKENELESIEVSVAAIKKEIEALEKTFEAKCKALDEWKFTIKNEMAENEAEWANNTTADECSMPPLNVTNW